MHPSIQLSSPDSIVPCEFFQKFMNIALRFMNAKDKEEKLTAVQELTDSMSLIPRDNYFILQYICKFLRKVGTMNVNRLCGILVSHHINSLATLRTKLLLFLYTVVL